MTLGATPASILASVLRQGMVLAAAGLVLGLCGALGTTRLLAGLLFQVKPEDVATYAMVSGLLLAGSFPACYAPARRAARIDPQTALRCE